jgi:ABC-type sugar transport system ATPase subunit
MVGRDLTDYYPEKERRSQVDTVLEVQNLTKHNVFDSISFSLEKEKSWDFPDL